MTITRHTSADLALLLFAALMCGILISCVYIFLRFLPRVASAYKFAGFPKYKQFTIDFLSRHVGKVTLIIADMSLCLLFAIGLLAVSFIFNSGNFRLSSVPAMTIGYFLGISALSRIIESVLLNILFVFKWLLDILLFPVMWLGKEIACVCAVICKKTLKKRNDRLIAKYTSQRLAQINNVAEFGLIEKYYKELLK